MMRPRAAFTLVEMMVALSVTAVLSVLMLRMFMDSSTIWKSNDERLETFREARAALQLMARELAAVNAAPELPEKFPMLALQHHGDTLPEDYVNQEVYALSATRNTGHSDLCAVGYFCTWDDRRKTFTLRRQATESNATFANLQKALRFGSPMTPSGAFHLLYARPLPNADDDSLHEIATYVWNLQFIIPHPTNQTLPNPPWPQGSFWKELPEWVEIRFKALGSAAARKLDGQAITRETWFVDSDPLRQRLILPNEQQFITRVKLSR